MNRATNTRARRAHPDSIRRSIGLLVLALLSPPISASVIAQEVSPGQQDLTAVLQLLSEDYAGYPRFAGRWPERLEAAIGRARADMVDTEGEAGDHVIREFLAVFHDGHLLLHSQFSPAVDMPTPMFHADRTPLALPIASDAFLIRVPSFAAARKAELDRLLNDHAEEIRSRPYLVIDIRGNTGGSDSTWAGLMEPISDGPLQRWPVLWRVSEGNAKALETQAERARAQGAAPALCTNMRSIAEAMRRPHDAELVPLGPPLASTVPASEVLAQPARVGILIDGSCSSSAENFLLAARQSKKVTLFGARTFGAMDFQNVRMAPLPSGKRQLMFGMTMSTRLDDQAAEPERGIAPEVPLDVRILRDADRGVDHALTSLRRSAGD